MASLENINIDIDKKILENIDIDKDILENIDIDKDILENNNIDIEKGILQNIVLVRIWYIEHPYTKLKSKGIQI